MKKTRSKLEELVPTLDMCKQIPEGKFNDSALVWARPGNIGVLVGEDDLWEVFERASLEKTDEMLPAPTLSEIMEALPTCVVVSGDSSEKYLNLLDARNKGKGWQVGYASLGFGKFARHDFLRQQYANPATAALKMWLEVNCVEVKDE